MDTLDIVEIKFEHTFMFISEESFKFLDQGTKLKQKISPQAYDSRKFLITFLAVMKIIEEKKEVAQQSLSAAVAVTFVFQIFLNSALGQLWSLVNAL